MQVSPQRLQELSPRRVAELKEVAKLRNKLKAKGQKLEEAEQTIEALRSSLFQSEEELLKAQLLNLNLEKRVKLLAKPPTEPEIVPEFIRNMQQTFMKTTAEISHERGEV